MTNVQKEWADRFDANVENLPVYIKEVEQFFKDNPDSLYGEDVYPETILELSPEKIKTFITNLLASHNNSLVERLEEMRPARKTEEETHNTYNDGKRDLIDQAQELIKNSLTKKTKP